MGSVLFTARASSDWRSPGACEGFLRTLVASGDFFVPEKFDDHEPERWKFDPADFRRPGELWHSDVGRLFLSRRKPFRAWLNVRVWPVGVERFHEILGGFDERYFAHQSFTDCFLRGVAALHEWGAFEHAYACHEDEWNVKNYLGQPTRLAGGKVGSTGGIRLEEQLPGVYWMNLFGRRYVDFLGPSRFRDLGFCRQLETTDGARFVITSDSPLHRGDPGILGVQDRVVDTLGRRAFFDRLQPAKPAYAPSFTFGTSRPLVGIARAFSDPVGEVLGDLAAFIANAAGMAAEFSSGFLPPLDFSGEGLIRLDEFAAKKIDPDPASMVRGERRGLCAALTAYYGETVRRSCNGAWQVQTSNSGSEHPVIAWNERGIRGVEFPFARVMKVLVEGQEAGGFAERFRLLRSGEFSKLQDFLPPDSFAAPIFRRSSKPGV